MSIGICLILVCRVFVLVLVADFFEFVETRLRVQAIFEFKPFS